MQLFSVKAQKNNEFLSDVLMTVLYSSFVILSSDTAGVYIMVSLIGIIYALNLVSNPKVKHLHIGTFHLYMLLFAVFSLLSSFWAFSPEHAIGKGVTILELLISFSLLYAAYYHANIERLLRIIMWTGFLLAIYAIFYYGLDYFQQAIAAEDRLENEFANVNTLGMVCSTSILISFYYFKQRKDYIGLLFCAPALLVVAASGSRKALVTLVLGIVYLTIFQQNSDRKKNNKKILKVFGSLLLLGLFVIIIFESGLFTGSLNRFDGLIASFTGGEDADSSSMIRAYFRELGFLQFLSTPILGIGMDNAYILAYKATGRDCYLHCNYAELAANGGIVGLGLYYWIYIKILVKEYKYRKYDKHIAIIILVILLQLIMDYGVVSYYSKETYFLLMVAMLHMNKLNRPHHG